MRTTALVAENSSEQKARRLLTERLRSRFATVSSGEIEELVGSLYAEFADSRIRDFVPILVEREALRELRRRKP